MVDGLPERRTAHGQLSWQACEGKPETPWGVTIWAEAQVPCRRDHHSPPASRWGLEVDARAAEVALLSLRGRNFCAAAVGRSTSDGGKRSPTSRPAGRASPSFPCNHQH